jgi:capsule polysaccharide export protein KpsE/RkpR
LFVPNDYLEQAQEVLASYHSPSLVVGEIEGQLTRLESELQQIEQERNDLAPHLRTVYQRIEQLQTELQALNRKLDEE